LLQLALQDITTIKVFVKSLTSMVTINTVVLAEGIYIYEKEELIPSGEVVRK